MASKDSKAENSSFCLNRREFLLTGTGAIATTFLLSAPGMKGLVEAAGVQYPKKKIGRISELKNDVPVLFSYPFDDIYSQNLLIKLGVPASGGVGKGQDIVAFNVLCTHMGGLTTKYDAQHKVMGACPLHLTTFDVRKHGMVVAGHGTSDLPQIVLEVKGDDIYATGIIGLVFGKTDNLMKA